MRISYWSSDVCSSDLVMASLIPPKRDVVRANTPSAEDRAALFGGDAAQMDKPQHMARLLSWALADLMLAHPEIVIAGADVGPKGGVYNVKIGRAACRERG